MAFPQVVDADTQSGTVTSNSTSWTLTYPTNLQAGDLILAMVATDGGTLDRTWPSGWVAVQRNSGSAATLHVAAKTSDGTESGTFSLGLGSSEQGAWRIVRIVGWFGGLFTDAASGSNITNPASPEGTGIDVELSGFSPSSVPDPPNLNPGGWDIEDTLWIAAMAADTSRTVSGYPSNLTTDNDSLVSGGANGATLAWARTESAVASLDPGTFTISTSDDWAAVTIAIRPSAAPPPSASLDPFGMRGFFGG